MNGLLYLPSRNMTINGSSVQFTGNATMVFNTLFLNGSRWSVETSPKTIAPVSANTGTSGMPVHLTR